MGSGEGVAEGVMERVGGRDGEALEPKEGVPDGVGEGRGMVAWMWLWKTRNYTDGFA